MQSFFIKNESERNLIINKFILDAEVKANTKYMMIGNDKREMRQLLAYAIQMCQQYDCEIKRIHHEYMHIIFHNQSRIKFKYFPTSSPIFSTTFNRLDIAYLISIERYKNPQKLIQRLEESLTENGTLYIENIPYLNNFALTLVADAINNRSKYQYC